MSDECKSGVGPPLHHFLFIWGLGESVFKVSLKEMVKEEKRRVNKSKRLEVMGKRGKEVVLYEWWA